MYRFFILYISIFFIYSCKTKVNSDKTLNMPPIEGEQKIADCVLYFTKGNITPAGVAQFYMVGDSVKRMALTLSIKNLKNYDIFLQDGSCGDGVLHLDLSNNYLKNRNPIRSYPSEDGINKISVWTKNLDIQSDSKFNINTKKIIIVKDYKIIACGSIVSNAVRITL